MILLTGQLVCADASDLALVQQYLPLHRELTHAEPGCVSFAVEPTTDPLVWQVDECFADAAAFSAHQARVKASQWGRATAGMTRRYEIQGL